MLFLGLLSDFFTYLASYSFKHTCHHFQLKENGKEVPYCKKDCAKRMFNACIFLK